MCLCYGSSGPCLVKFVCLLDVVGWSWRVGGFLKQRVFNLGAEMLVRVQGAGSTID